MNTKRIEEIQKETAYPDSISVQQALLKVWNECQQEKTVKNNTVLSHFSNSSFKKGTGTYMIVMTLTSALCAVIVGYGFKSLDAAIAVGLFINIALSGAVRFNQ